VAGNGQFSNYGVSIIRVNVLLEYGMAAFLKQPPLKTLGQLLFICFQHAEEVGLRLTSSGRDPCGKGVKPESLINGTVIRATLQ